MNLRTPATGRTPGRGSRRGQACGTVITTRQLPGPAGLVVVTDHDPADGQTITVIMNGDGNYLPAPDENAGEQS